MATLNIHRVNELPVTPDVHSLYVIRKQEFERAELVFTSAEGIALPVLDTASVQNMISTAIATASGITILQDINERDTYDFTGDSAVYIVDASADPEVIQGSALYFYKKESNTFTLILCAKHTYCNDILGKLDATAQQIDEAVSKMHTHANLDVLESITEGEDGTLFYKGAPINDIKIATVDW